MDLSSNRHATSSGSADSREMAVSASRGVAGVAGSVDLHICPECSSHLVYPQEWAPVDMCHWRVELRCPECEWRQVGLYEQAVLDRFDQILDAGADELVADLSRLQQANMEEELARFNAALSCGLILPEDF